FCESTLGTLSIHTLELISFHGLRSIFDAFFQAPHMKDNTPKKILNQLHIFLLSGKLAMKDFHSVYPPFIAAPQFRIWSPTTLLSVALFSLTNVDRTGNSAFCMVWPQPKDYYETEFSCLLNYE
ncbi:hypothetical protein METBIDRAFT_31250, partial [Metschnikowia bicuspidata var. bicuspidata NRRL YB-4993]